MDNSQNESYKTGMLSIVLPCREVEPLGFYLSIRRDNGMGENQLETTVRRLDLNNTLARFALCEARAHREDPQKNECTAGTLPQNYPKNWSKNP
jgi:hypothetical protein